MLLFLSTLGWRFSKSASCSPGTRRPMQLLSTELSHRRFAGCACTSHGNLKLLGSAIGRVEKHASNPQARPRSQSPMMEHPWASSARVCQLRRRQLFSCLVSFVLRVLWSVYVRGWGVSALCVFPSGLSTTWIGPMFFFVTATFSGLPRRFKFRGTEFSSPADVCRAHGSLVRLIAAGETDDAFESLNHALQNWASTSWIAIESHGLQFNFNPNCVLTVTLMTSHTCVDCSSQSYGRVGEHPLGVVIFSQV